MVTLEKHNGNVVTCRKCPRLVRWREACAKKPPRRYRNSVYWAKPLPGFGDSRARVLIVGLAPAAHGGNRTGRMFTGDRSGDWLYGALHAFGFANQANSEHRGDGLKLKDCYITAAVRCAPPKNKPSRAEFIRCRPYLVQELKLFNNLRVVKISREETPSIPPPPSTHKPTKLKTQEEGTAEEKSLVEQTSAPINKQLQKETKSKSGEIEQQIPTPSSAKESMKKAEDSRAERTPSPTGSIEKKAEPKMAKNEQGENPLPSPTPLAEKPAKTEMEKKEATKENTETTPQTEHGGKYTIQIGSFKTEEEAKETAENLISKGYPAFETTAHIPGKGTWYRVRIGTFKTINEAKIYGDKLKSLEPSVESVFVTVNN